MLGIGIGISPLLSRYTGSGYNAVTSDWISRVYSNEGTLTSTEKEAVNTYTNSIDTDEFDFLAVHGLQNEIAALTPVITTSGSIITNVNSTTFTAGEGFTGNGSTMYLNTNYNPSINGYNFTLNSGCIGVYSRTNEDGSFVDIGLVDDSTNRAMMFTKFFGSNYVYINNSGDTFHAITNSTGLICGVRTNSNTLYSYQNGVSLGNSSKPASQLVDGNIFILAAKVSGVANFFSNKQISLSFVSSGNINQSSFYTATQTLATTLGFNV